MPHFYFRRTHMDIKEKKINSNCIFKGKILSLYVDEVRCPNDNISTREIIKHHGGVCVLAIDGESVIFVKQYRYAYDETLYELPAGKLEENENPYEAACRELEEETGYKTTGLIDYGKMYPTCGYSNEIIYLYVAEKLIKTKQHLDEDEFLETYKIPLKQVVEMIEDGTIKDAKTICLISKYILKANKKSN